MIGELTNHLWQSTLFAILAGLLTAALRANRARVRYSLWLIASLKFFVPFALIMILGSHLPWTPASAPIATSVAPAVSLAVEEFTQPFSGVFPSSSAVSSAPRAFTGWTTLVLSCVWACGFVAIALIRLHGWRRIRGAVRASTPLEIAGLQAGVQVRSAPGLLGPGVVGVWRPILLVPVNITTHLRPRQLDAVLAHELCHVRRRDNLTAAIHMIVETAFWFHPLVWWISARLVDERERACDEEVLQLGGEPQVYAEGILNICKLYIESPLACVSGVTGADLKKRIHDILAGHVAIDLSIAKKVALAMAATAAIAVPLVVGMMTAPLRAQSPSVAAAGPRFDVASIKPCDTRSLPPGARSGTIRTSAGRLSMNCVTVDSFIRWAYVEFANGQRLGFGGPTPLSVERGPAWIESERYTINAVTEGHASPEMLQGPMLQAILEERFQLKTHRETRQGLVYELSVAKSGLKLKRAEEGSCTPRDPANRSRPLDPGEKPYCGQATFAKNRNDISTELRSITLEELARSLSDILGVNRLVIDKTGIVGKFDLLLQYALDENSPLFLADAGDAGDAFPSIFSALQQFGLKLAPAKGPNEFLVIDHVERPSEN